MPTITLACFKCGASLNFIDRVGRREECPQCHEDVHVCRNCEFYDAKVYNECREPAAEVVRDKERANHCDYFRPGAGTGGATSSKDALRAAAEALFKKRE